MYLCIERLVQLTRSLPEGGSVVDKLVQQMLEDIKPMASQTKVMIWKGKRVCESLKYKRDVPTTNVKHILDCSQSSIRQSSSVRFMETLTCQRLVSVGKLN